MNTLFGDMAKRVEAFDPNREAIIAAKSAEDEIIEFNVEDQLYDRGIDSAGLSLGEYRKKTKVLKGIKSAAGLGDGKVSNMTLRDTGDFHKSFKVKYGNDRFEIEATDPKTPEIIDSFGITGENILGLTDENLQRVKDDYIRPGMQQAFRNKILI